jgi:regulator of protease activity HflC (stomatin/prohibitin superfamily)
MLPKTNISELDRNLSLDNLEKDVDLRLTEDILLTSNSPGINDTRWKIPFGFVIARPHEYLIHIRKGQLLPSTGQAKRCFKRPGDTVVLIPTTLKQLIFESGQVTLDNIHVRIRGFAIYRIVDPEKTYERISFWNRQEGEKKLARVIGEPCRSHTKWLVSNMTMDDCIRKRKESIADILLKELRLAITEEKTGVSIETVDIQDVRFGDDHLFESFQGPSKEDILKNQELAELFRQREVKLQKLKQERELAEKQKECDIEILKNKAEVILEQHKNERMEAEERRRTVEVAIEHDESLADMKEERRLNRKQKAAMVERELALAELQLKKQQAELEMEILKQRSSIENSLTPAALEKAFLEDALPNVAKAVASSLGDARITIYQSPSDAGGSPFGLVLNEVMSIFRNRINQLAGMDVDDQSDADESY